MKQHGAEPLWAARFGGDWPRAEGVTLRALTLYRDACGSLDPLFIAAGIAAPMAGVTLTRHMDTLSVTQLATLTGRAIAQLAARDNVLAGRPILRRCDWRVILYSLSGARTLREALARCAECFEAIDWRCGRMTLVAKVHVAELALDAMRPSAGDPATGCLIDLFGLTHIHSLLHGLIGQPIPIRYVALDCSEAVLRSLDLAELPFTLNVSAGWSGFAFDATLLDYPVVRTAEELAALPMTSLLFGSGVMTESGLVPQYAEQVRRLTLRALSEDRRLPLFDEIVATLGGSAATLRRRLAREGTSYRRVRESCRREIALDLLSRTSMPIEDVAARLDYCDSDAFRQAFRDWTGVSPSEYRKAVPPAPQYGAAC